MGWFSRNTPGGDLISKQDRLFVEENLISLASNMGTELFQRNGQLFPIYENFPFRNLREKDQLHGLVRKVADYIGFTRTDIRLDVFDKKESRWVSGFPYVQSELPETALTILVPGAEQLHPDFLITTIVLQLLQFKIRAVYEEGDTTYLAELAAGFYGFAVPCIGSYSNQHFLPGAVHCMLYQHVHLYVLLLLIHVRGDSRENCRAYLDEKLHFSFDSLHKMLLNENSYSSFSAKWKIAEEKYPFVKTVSDPLSSEEAKVAAYTELIRMEPGNADWYNNRGYALLHLNKFDQAISDFDKSIDLDPYWSFPFNNRGFAYLNLGKLSRGKEDIETAFRLDGDNGYAKRNLGYYHFLKKEYSEALRLYQEAKKVQAKIEHIHYFTGLAYLALGEKENARKEFDLSRALPEVPVPVYPEI